ncbi:hypothetical protein [Treponema porcinum]
MKTPVIYKKLSQKKGNQNGNRIKKDRRPKGERKKADGLENENLIYIFK